MRPLRSPNDAIGRRALPHDPPHFIGTADAVFFVTICCQAKGRNQLCHREVKEKLFASVRDYHAQHKWSIPLLVLMPDHLHMLVRFGSEIGMKKTIRSWKRYTARHFVVNWQRDFFDHRLRSDESFDEKARYIRDNPVRAGLIERSEDWPYQLQLG